ncbi:MAG: hypothetical protein LLF94_03975 [Chlamydiales bacterium]|nr:hypothetical protein [Chlamydiales bacterium]
MSNLVSSNPVLSGPAIVYDHVGNLEKFKALPNDLPRATMPLSESALVIFNQIQQTGLDSTHTVKKYGSAALAFGASIGCATGAIWYVMPRTAYDWGKVLAPVALGTTLNYITQKTFNFSLVGKIQTIGKVALSLGINFVKERTYGHYVNVEKEINYKHQTLRQTIFKDLQESFNGMASVLKNEYLEAEESPAAIYKLKTSCKNLTHHIDIAKKGMQEVGLANEDIALITKKFQKTAQKIQNYAFSLSDNPAHNLEMLLNVPEASTSSLCIPQQAQEFVDIAIENVRTRSHDLEKWSGTGLASVIVGAIPYAASEYNNASVITKMLACAGSLGLGMVTGKCTLNYFADKHAEMDQQVVTNLNAALDSTCAVYDDLAKHIASLAPKKRKRTEDPQVQIASALKEKIPYLQKQMELQSINSDTVLKNLNQTLDTILKPPLAKKPATPKKTTRRNK